MGRLKDVIQSILAVLFISFAFFVINKCDCETSIFDDVTLNMLESTDAGYCCVRK